MSRGSRPAAQNRVDPTRSDVGAASRNAYFRSQGGANLYGRNYEANSTRTVQGFDRDAYNRVAMTRAEVLSQARGGVFGNRQGRGADIRAALGAGS